jgi:hypothetical protein
VKLWIRSIEPPQRGHCHSEAELALGGPAFGQLGAGIRSSCWQTGNRALRRAVRQEAEKADTHKAMREHMQKKAAQKLFRRYYHELLFAAMRIILPAKRDLAIGKGNDPMIRDSNAMCVAGQVMKDVLRASERRLGIHDPILVE